MMKSMRILTLVFMVAFLASGCLKTRAQIRDEKRSDEEGAPNPISSAKPSSYALDEIKSEITRLSGKVEDLERQSRNPVENDSQKKLEERLFKVEQTQLAIVEAIKNIEKKLPAQDEVDLFQKGKAQYEAGQLDEAIESLSGYLRNPKGKHVEEATFVRAESYYAQKKYKKAIADYSQIPEKYPQSKRHPASLYKIGLSFDSLGFAEDAKRFYEYLVQKFPKSDLAKQVSSKLKPKSAGKSSAKKG